MFKDKTEIIELQPSEAQIQKALIEVIKLRARQDVIYFHIPNGELRDKRTAAKLKAMGVLPGVSDLEFIWSDDRADGVRHRKLFLELKRPGEMLSDDQAAFGLAVMMHGCSFEWADNLDQAIRILEDYGIFSR